MKGFSVALMLFFVAGPATAAGSPGLVIDGERFMPPRLELCAAEAYGGSGVASGFITDSLPEGTARSPIKAYYSPIREGAASFLLPGLGQLRMGKTIRSKFYFAFEGLAWIAMGSFLWQGHSREESFKEYAVAYAGVAGTDRSDDYWEHIGGFSSNEGTGGYNEWVRREARDMYYPDRAAMDAYYISNRYLGSMSWRWRSDSEREKYNVLRDGSKSSNRRALYSLVFALTLRVISTVDAVRIARVENAAAKAEQMGLSLKIGGFHKGFSVAVKKSF